MNEPTVTIKMTKTELTTLNEMITTLPDSRLPVYVVKLRKQLNDIEERLNEKIREAVNDKRISEEGSEEQTQMEDSKGVCAPCED